MGDVIGGTMGELVRSGRIVDIALGLIVLEIAVLAWLRPRAGGRVLDFGFFAHLAAGGFLLLALRAALTGAGWETIAAWLAGGLVAHLADLSARLRSGRRGD